MDLYTAAKTLRIISATIMFGTGIIIPLFMFRSYFAEAVENGRPHQIMFNMIAQDGDGLCIPSMLVVFLAKNLANNEITIRDAYPCVGFITPKQYLASLRALNVHWQKI